MAEPGYDFCQVGQTPRAAILIFPSASGTLVGTVSRQLSVEAVPPVVSVDHFSIHGEGAMAVTVTIQLLDTSKPKDLAFLSQSSKGVTLSTDSKNPQSQWAISAVPSEENATTVYSLIRNVASGSFLQFDTSLPPINGERPVTVTTHPVQAAIFLIGGGPPINGRLPVQVMPPNDVFLQGDLSDSLVFLGPIQNPSESGWVFTLAK